MLRQNMPSAIRDATTHARVQIPKACRKMQSCSNKFLVDVQFIFRISFDNFAMHGIKSVNQTIESGHDVILCFHGQHRQ